MQPSHCPEHPGPCQGYMQPLPRDTTSCWDALSKAVRHCGLGKTEHISDGEGALVSSLNFVHVCFMTRLDWRHYLSRCCREFVKEEEADKVLFRNTFGTQRLGGWITNMFDLYLKNPANTNVFEWNSQLFAIWEVCCPPAMPPFA